MKILPEERPAKSARPGWSLRPLPPHHGIRERWPRGWWLSEGAYGCVECGMGGVAIEVNQPMFLSGEPGEVFCETHASLE